MALIGVTVGAACRGTESSERTLTLTAPERDAGGTDVAIRFDQGSDSGALRPGEHFHLFVDVGCAAHGEASIADLDRLELAATSTSSVVHLSPGQHQLCLQLADGAHAATDLTSRANVNIAIESTEEWCAVADEIDSLFETIDTSDEPFTSRQIGYRDVARLFEQLAAALDVFDAGDRAAVAADIDLGVQIITAMIDAPDEQHAQAALADIVQDPQVGRGVEARQQLCHT